MVHKEIQKVYFMNKENLLKNCEKQGINDSVTLVLTYHPALNKVQEILKKVYTLCEKQQSSSNSRCSFEEQSTSIKNENQVFLRSVDYIRFLITRQNVDRMKVA